jgi:glucose/arabinose dehydrogenase
VSRLSLALGLSLLVAAPAAAQLRADLVVSGLAQPVAFVQNPADPTMQVIVQQGGRVRVLKDGGLQAADFLDLSGVISSGGERGLLGLAFSPDYASSGRFFVNFTNPNGDTVIARFRRSVDPLRADPGTRFDLRWPNGQRVISQPFSNHNGGNLVFGPDGFLYIGLGDGGAGDDPQHNAQNPQTLLGKFLRINVQVPDSDPEGYDIPPGNPFVGNSNVLDEIWSFGWRNPWRWSFDDPARGGTGALIVGDVGQNRFEEIDYEPAGRAGRNYGWRNREGAHDNVTNLAPFSQPLTDPIFEYGRVVGGTVTGGYVYRGAALGQAFRGRYFFADFLSSRVFSLRLTINPFNGEATADDLQEHTGELGGGASIPSSFGVDASGELYVVNYGGSIHRIANNNPVPIPPDPIPPGPGPGPGPDPEPPSPPSSGHRPRPPEEPPVGRAGPRPAPVEPEVAAGVKAAMVLAQARLPVAALAAAEWFSIEEADVNDDGKVDVTIRAMLHGTLHVWVWLAEAGGAT